MPDFRPGDLGVVRHNTLVRRWLTEEEHWTTKMEPCLVLATGIWCRRVNDDGNDTDRILVLLRDGAYIVANVCVYTPDQVADPSRLFPLTRLREP